MFGIGVPELLVLLLLVMGLGLVIGLTALAARSGTPGGTPADRQVAREWRLVQATRGLGVVAGLLVAAQVYQRGSYGVGPMLAPAAFGLCVVLATALGETVVRPRRPAGVRTASLTPRRIADYLPRITSVLVAAMLAITTATVVLTTVTASRDAGTGSMRALRCETASSGSSHTPYPGSYYTLPLALLLVAVLLVAVLAARQVVRRPRGMAGTILGDDVLRRRSLDVIVAATGVAIGAPLVGIALTAGSAMNDLAAQRPTCAPGWMGAVGITLMLTALLALLATCVCVVRLLAGSPGRVTTRDPAPTTR